MVLGMLLIIINGCKKTNTSSNTNPLASIPTVTTTPISVITQTTANSGGNITSNGGGTITGSGVCWSTNPNPTIADTKITNSALSVSYTSNLTGLVAGTTYHVRAFATNSVGTGYGNDLSFTTQANTTGTVTDIDGNIYHTVAIGGQIWMVENLKTTKYRDGTNIPNVTDNGTWFNLTTDAYCNYNNISTNSATYGKLYNWYAVNDVRNIAPLGWRVATQSDWIALATFIGGNNLTNGVSVGAGKLKEAGTTHWIGPNTGATNESGFTALPGGNRYIGAFDDIGYNGYWWTSTPGPGNAYNYPFYVNMNYATRYLDIIFNYSFTKDRGLAVRCVKE